jgi:TPR repeat protein
MVMSALRELNKRGFLNKNNIVEVVNSLVLQAREQRGPVTVQTSQQLALLFKFAENLIESDFSSFTLLNWLGSSNVESLQCNLNNNYKCFQKSILQQNIEKVESQLANHHSASEMPFNLTADGLKDSGFNGASVISSKKVVKLSAFAKDQLDADQGDPIAQEKLGARYEKGNGISKNWIEALKYYKLAADQDRPHAKFKAEYLSAINENSAFAAENVAYHFTTGIGTGKNFKKAFQFRKFADDQGNAIAQFNLGLCFESGKGTPKNLNLAYCYYKLAGNQGHEIARSNANRLFETTIVFLSNFLGLFPVH